MTGGREYANLASVRAALSTCGRVTRSCTSPLRGADSLAASFAKGAGYKTESHPANWATYSKSAGSRRNAEMLRSGVALLIAFPGGVRTVDMVRRAVAAGVPVVRAG